MAATQTPTADDLGLVLPTGEDIYDALMSQIEMDLLSVNLPLLEEKYKEETPEQRAERLERYRKAYEQYDKALAEWIATLHATVDRCKREVLKLAEEKERATDLDQMTELENAFQATTDQ